MEKLKYFFSYAHRDAEFVLKLAQELRSAGANLWLDQLDILGGQLWDRAVEEALKDCKGMIAVLSPEALASQNVMDEVSYALEEGKLVVPVLLCPCDIPYRLRRVQYVDFTADYDIGFSRLMSALHIELSQTATEHSIPQKHVAQKLKSPVIETPAVARKPLKEKVTQQPVVVIGDATAKRVASQLRNGKVSVSEDKSSISSTSLIVIAMDYTQGVMPVHEEIAREISLSSNPQPKLLWIFTNTSGADDEDLIELVELEVRELLARHNFDSDTILFAVDVESAPVHWNLKGWTAIIRFVAGEVSYQ